MNTQQLIADAVRNSKDRSESTLWDRLFSIWFRRLVYTQIWEDPEADLAALQLPTASTIVTISSGGCNALSYLTAKPAQVFAVDLNEAHLALLKLKLAGLRALSDYADFWRYFGEGSSADNAKLYRDRLRPQLDADARGFWDERDFRGRPRYRYFTNGFYRHGALGHFIGFAHRLAKFAKVDLAALLTAEADSPARIEALARLHRLFHSGFARFLTKTPALLFSLGIPPQQRDLLGGDQPLNEVLHARLLRLINVYPNATNYFAWQALQRSYKGPGDSCLPLYLQRSKFELMRAGAGLVTPVHANLRVFLESLPARQVDAVVLLDSQDWMAPDEIRALWDAIDRAGSDSVRVIFRTAGAESPLDTAALTPLRQIWERDAERSAIGFDQDRSGIYGGFHCYARRGAITH
ncbi:MULTISPECIES: BtaA family protein [Rhodopseudomonas]|uniref:S-adenosylmethionine:diacylglycerol 3-amino-3-carboxypropyl transferase n=1 Tax=Rhodopseudomonas palustris TaxID=1076 RepID=A0A0D7EEJ2_RHOPL|nr:MULTISPECIES: BtaA family protein [Rhodopseudomonas]KIZ38940.1 S-adenosylmethionine:diacylglycerol 3-amino-3-carboxypropyl transferase [Rhodopseudomonas palustris]MDF3810952.1 BtaA family protein [Rhodopseudomonas sp. BAL398]WOK16925.1 BtaA family protein [Rhodopseudomonas sp. BAL398]